MLYIAMKFCK